MFVFVCLLVYILMLFVFFYLPWGSLTVSLSADINVTANLLGELDRLIQMLESPIFTCELPMS